MCGCVRVRYNGQKYNAYINKYINTHITYEMKSISRVSLYAPIINRYIHTVEQLENN